MTLALADIVFQRGKGIHAEIRVVVCLIGKIDHEDRQFSASDLKLRDACLALYG